MPRRQLNPFAAGNTANAIAVPVEPPPPYTEKPCTDINEMGRRLPSPKVNKIASFFATVPRTKAESYTATAALKQAATSQQQYNCPPQQISSPSLSLPTISLSTSHTDDGPTTLWSPPSQTDMRKKAREEAQFGTLCHPTHRYTSRHVGKDFPEPIMDEPPYYYLLTTYISYLILILFGHVRDYFGKRFRPQHYRHLQAQDGYAPLNSDFDNFYVRRLKMRLNDSFARPVTGVPGRLITLIDRSSEDFNLHFKFTGSTTETLNMSSYNYL